MLNKSEPVYLAGPMTGYKSFNVPAFMAGRDELEQMGFTVQLPGDLDDPTVVEQLLASPDGTHSSVGGPTWGDCLAIDVKLISDVVGGVVVLPGWNKSRGARLETFVAFLNGKPIVYFGSLRGVSRKQLAKAWLGELLS